MHLIDNKVYGYFRYLRCDLARLQLTMAMLCPHHTSSGSGAHGSSGSASRRATGSPTTAVNHQSVTTTVTCDNCGSMMREVKKTEQRTGGDQSNTKQFSANGK